jgi:hypothetical protein
MCEAIVLENMIVDRIEQAAEIFGEAAMVRHPDDPFDDDLTDEYGPRLPQPGDCLCYLDIEATAERAGYIANIAPYDLYHRWVITKRSLPIEHRVLQWIGRNVWVFVVNWRPSCSIIWGWQWNHPTEGPRVAGSHANSCRLAMRPRQLLHCAHATALLRH